MPDDEMSPQELADFEKRERKRTYRQLLADLGRVLDNSDGFERLQNISDEEWQAAEDAGAGGSDAS